MAEVTRVPIQPIEKGSLTKLWLGVIVAVLIGAGIAWSALPTGIEVEEITAGTGASPSDGDVAFIKYKGMLDDGTVFDEADSSPFPPGVFPDGIPMLIQPGQMVEGFYQGLKQMEKGGKYTLRIPAELAYGDAPPPQSQIPPGSDLTFEVELVDFMSQEDAERRFSIMQQMMQGQGAPGGPQGAPEGAPVPQP
ncbi:peptidylprolyl isomerase [Altererythrobacter sp. BO-6]|uniref:FKBP-type peptidyl-prolyl cis-trans isomerase n=1 Tax=Altererythrobacter sp. BO-6 TaxID=2604537 RepID=UPI0013E10DC8|nr:FKBP-type peptidyl-prolyl cis-trans isomerase [Altererythrobacter sp. BO-6]QIG54817.1 peptidylprolyl isomerase [Altererythrobacter sp. BO-6]